MNLLDRQAIREFLLAMTQALRSRLSRLRVTRRASGRMLASAGSELEQAWLNMLDADGYRLPTHSQQVIPECGTRPDFLYLEPGHQAAIYIDGPPHDFPAARRATTCIRSAWRIVATWSSVFTTKTIGTILLRGIRPCSGGQHDLRRRLPG